MTGSGGGNSMASTGSFLPTKQTAVKKHHGKDHYGLPVHAGGLSFHEKTLLGLMGWWLAMNILGIFYALFAIDFNGDGIFQSETTTSTVQKIGAMFFRIISLGVFGTRPRPHGSLDQQEGGGGSLKGPGVFKFLVALLGFLFLGVLFPSNITSANESFIDLGGFPDFFGKSKNKPGDIMGNASNIASKLMGGVTSTSTLTKEHDTMLDNIKNRNEKFKTGTKEWEKKFNNIDFSQGGDWASKVFGRNNGTYYMPKNDEWKGWRKNT
jgi:hypothetical protein